jgi:hypothetical protein
MAMNAAPFVKNVDSTDPYQKFGILRIGLTP